MRFYIDLVSVTKNEFSKKLIGDSSETLLKSFDLNQFCEKLELHLTKRKFSIMKDKKVIQIDVQKSLSYHYKSFNSQSIFEQPLFKALGLKKGRKNPHVLDCTAGMLKDSLLIYSALKTVSCCERHPLVSLLISEALAQQKLSEFKMYYKSCRDIDLTYFDTLYFDPMYGEVNAKALPGKEMQFFRSEVGIDEDRESTLEYLLEAKKRVVVKRSKKAKPLKQPHLSFGKKSTIYDVYLP